MASDAPNPRAWRVATALAGEAGLDWAAWARGESAVTCPVCDGHGGENYGVDSSPCGCCDAEGVVTLNRAREFAAFVDADPVPWDADAYRADVARRGVEPGPMPSLHGRTVNGLDWCVFDNAIEFRSGTVKWFMRGDELQVTHTVVPITREQWVEIGILATAAKRAMGT